MNELTRNSIIRIYTYPNGEYAVTDKQGEKIMSKIDDYVIYLKNLKFSKDGFVEARFIGTVQEDYFNSLEQPVVYKEDKGWVYAKFGLRIHDAKIGDFSPDRGINVLLRAE